MLGYMSIVEWFSVGRSGGVGPGGGDRRALGALVLFLALSAGRAVNIVFPGLARLQR